MIMDQALLYPIAAQVFLSFIVLILLAKRRFTAIAQGKSDLKYFRLFQGEGEPDHVRVVQRNLTNQFELPVLFFVGCFAAQIFGRVDEVFIWASWAYVALRALHVFVHTGANNPRVRLAVWASSNLVLLFSWVWMLI